MFSTQIIQQYYKYFYHTNVPCQCSMEWCAVVCMLWVATWQFVTETPASARTNSSLIDNCMQLGYWTFDRTKIHILITQSTDFQTLGISKNSRYTLSTIQRGFTYLQPTFSSFFLFLVLLYKWTEKNLGQKVAGIINCKTYILFIYP